MNTGNTMNTRRGTWLRENHVLWKFRGTWHPCSQVPISISPISPIGPIFLCLHPVHRTKCSASQWECALLLGESHAHGARGKPYFSPRVPPFRPACCIEACGTQCGGMVPLPCGRLSGLRPLEPPALKRSGGAVTCQRVLPAPGPPRQ